ncbi:mechanosensitive ion channel family protein [Vulcanococcus limneticus]|uniref:mechanosensitive ion channel family protein n=1 Tax=Vulcanococcus limneticus TaxID=2170428 RepID=UPI00398C13F5
MTIRRTRLLAQLLGVLVAVLLLGGPGWTAAPSAPAASPPGVWVTLDGQRVIELRGAAGSQTPDGLAERISRELLALARENTFAPGQLVVEEDPPYWMVAERQADGETVPRLAVDERSAQRFGLSQRALAERYRDQLQAAIRQYRSRHSLKEWLRGTALALLVLGIYLGWVFKQRRLHKRLWRRLVTHCPPLSFGSIQLLEPAQLRPSLLLGLNLLHWSLLLLISYLLIPLLLGFFPPTQVLAAGLRSQILVALQALVAALFGVLPSLASIGLILAITALLLRASNAWFQALDQEQVRLPGFYPEWGRPTGRIAAVLIVMVGLVVAYPYIPGTGSSAFQGAGLFVGLLAALGSSAVASNVISGVMLIYTRGFREGDRVDINGVVGLVQDRALLVTRIRTPRNEVVSIPNAVVIGASIVNYSLSRRENDQPVAVSTTVTIGYDVPWRQVYALLLAAARSVNSISAEPEPYVLQTSLNDFHISYELNASVHDVQCYRQTLSSLLEAIQDQFAAAGVEILSPGYQAMRNGNRSTVPSQQS